MNDNNEKKSPYIDIPEFRKIIESILQEAVDSWDATGDDSVQYMKDCAPDYLPDYVEGIIDETITSFDKYVHQSDTSLFGNFADIRLDYERSHEKPFRSIIAEIDSGLDESEDAKEFREWSIDWYFNAFGAYNLKYKWTECMVEATYDED